MAAKRSKVDVEQHVFEEVAVSGFAHIDQEVAFFTQVAALLNPDDILLDFGAGRGEFCYEDPSAYRRNLQSFRGRCKHVDGCDVDPAVLSNPCLDEARLIRPGEPLPYENERFDLVVSRYVFEHIPDPDWAMRELLRVTKPGGWICALTPNKWGYVAVGARLIPNSLHARALHYFQPHRKEMDVFPTVYRLNSVRDVRKRVGENARVYHFKVAGVPSYHFGNPAILRLLLLLQRFLPPWLYPGLALFIRKHDEAAAPPETADIVPTCARRHN